jgi:CRISPR/Cas system-associated exonuclease Cas4 (RecB family)
MGPDYLSVSQVNTYLICPRKYHFRYIDRLRPDFRSAALTFGSAVHATVAWYQEERINGLEPLLADVRKIFLTDWASEIALGDVRFDKKSPEQLCELGALMVERFVIEAGNLVPDAVDVKVVVPLIDPRTGRELAKPLVGYLDGLSDGELFELKTAARKSSPSKWSLQLSMYAYAVERQAGARPRAKVIQLVKTNTPAVIIDDYEVSDAEVAWSLEVIAEVSEAIDVAAFPPSPSWACRACEFRSVCRAA